MSNFIYFVVCLSGVLTFSESSFASPISNRIFKNLHEHISSGDHEKAIYYLRNHSRELVGVDKTLAKYAQGVLGVLRGDYIEGEKELAHAESLEELHVYINYYKALSRFNQNQFGEAEKFLKKSLSEKKIQRKLKQKIDYLYGRIDLKKGKGLAAYKKLNPLLYRWKGDSKRAELLEILLEASIGKKLFSKGRYCKWFRDLYVDHPTNAYSDEWGLKSKGMKFNGRSIGCSINLSKQRSKLRRYYLEGLNGDILKHLADIKEVNADSYRKLLSSYYYYIGEPKKSLGVLASNSALNENYDEQVRIARVSYYAGESEKTLFIYKSLYEKETRSRKKAKLLFDLAGLNLEISNYKTAEIYYQTLLRNHSKSSYARQVEWLLPWSMYLGAKYEESYKGFVELAAKIKKRPNRYKRIDSKQVYYWAARALQKSGQENVAASIYKQLIADPMVSYYSILSALRLEDVAKKNQVLLTKNDFLQIPWQKRKDNITAKKNRFLESFKLSTRMPSSLHVGNDNQGVPIVDLEASFPKEEEEKTPVEASRYSVHLQRYTYLSRLGFWDDANEELVLVKKLSKTKGLKEKLLGYFESTGDYKNMARLASMSFHSERHFAKPDVAFKFWSSAYPKAYEEHVIGASSLFNVSKNLVWGIMRAESYFSPQILSPVGARGLLQVMPYTGSKILSILSGKNPLSDVVTREKQSHISKSLLEPKTNIRYGAKYLSRLNKQFKGHMPFIAASYNGGPHRVMMWSSMFGEIDQDEFTERVPFKETRGYIKKVMRNMFVYSSLYDREADMFHLIRPTAYVHKERVPTAEYWGKL